MFPDKMLPLCDKNALIATFTN